MEYKIKRYTLEKEFIDNGILTVIGKGQNTCLNYADPEINETVNELNHPIVALESLRKILETKYNSVLACIGCRIDTTYRPTGGYATWYMISGQAAGESVNMFEPTDKIELLCTIDQQREAYKNWLTSFQKKSLFDKIFKK